MAFYTDITAIKQNEARFSQKCISLRNVLARWLLSNDFLVPSQLLSRHTLASVLTRAPTPKGVVNLVSNFRNKRPKRWPLP